MAPGRWGAVLFDLDGTLADTIELILRSYRHTMETHLGRAPPDERFLSTMGKPLPVQLRDFAADPTQAEAMRQTYIAFQREAHDGLVKPYPEAGRVLRSLRGDGVPVAVVTSKATGIAERTLACCGLLELVDELVCADQVERPKPDPQSVVVAMNRLGVAHGPERVLFVGDSPFDMRAGREAGVRTAAALWGPFARGALEPERPDYWLETPEALLGLSPSL